MDCNGLNEHAIPSPGLSRFMAETVLVQNSLEEKMGMVALLDEERLTKPVDELIDR